MAVRDWKKFDFFNLDENASETTSDILKTLQEDGSGTEITCSTSGQSQKILCDSTGKVLIFYRNWKHHNIFQAHEPGTPIVLCELSPSNNHLVTVGYKGVTAEIKIWNLAKAKNKQAPCLKSFKSTVQRQKPTALAVINNAVVNSQMFLALGFERGDLILYKGDPTRSSDFSQTTLAVFSISSKKITGLDFDIVGKYCHLFICSDSGIIAYNFNSQVQLQQNSEKEFNKIVLDRRNEPSRCCTLQKHQDTYFLVGRDDAIYCFTADGRGPCYALEGQKILIKTFGNNLVSILKTNKPHPLNKEYTVTVFDIQNKFIVFSCPIEEITGILADDSGSHSGCFLIAKSKTIYHLSEKDLKSKLDILFNKSMFEIALKVSKDHYLQSGESDDEAIAEIYRLYGDHWYSKGSHTQAVEKYCKTIPFLEPSYVINKFLDSRHINCLADYLQALVKAGVASDEHRKLLKNCIKRLDLPNKIENHVQSPDGDCDNPFQSSDLLQIRSILQEMSYMDVEKLMKSNAYEIMKRDPVEAVRLFTGVCEDHPDIQPDFFIPYFSKDQKMELIEFLEYFINKTDNETVYNTLIELYLQRFSKKEEDEDLMLEKLKVFDGKYNKEFVLILCRFYEFWPGILYIYEERNLHNLSIRYYHQRQDYSNMIQSCETFGDNHPNLWIQALSGSGSTVLPTNVLLQVLGVISREQLLSPLQMAEALCVENGPKVGQLRDYFLQMFKKENEVLEQESEEVKNLKKDVVTLTDYIQNCENNHLEFGNTGCNACNQPLTLPSIYYLCRHAFHQDCVKNFSANEKDCTVCMKENLRLNELIQRSTSEIDEQRQHETFHNVIERSKDHLQVLSQYFSRGLFNKICIVDEKTQYMPPPPPPVIFQNRPVEQKVVKELPKPNPALNPFGDDEDSYDKEKNPFEDDNESDRGVGNPFDEEYDNNLNPFN